MADKFVMLNMDRSQVLALFDKMTELPIGDAHGVVAVPETDVRLLHFLEHQVALQRAEATKAAGCRIESEEYPALNATWALDFLSLNALNTAIAGNASLVHKDMAGHAVTLTAPEVSALYYALCEYLNAVMREVTLQLGVPAAVQPKVIAPKVIP